MLKRILELLSVMVWNCKNDIVLTIFKSCRNLFFFIIDGPVTSWGLLKPGIGWDWMGSDGTLSRVLAFGTFGSRVPGFDVIAITDLIYFQTPHSDYFPWQYIISLPSAMFFAQIQADSFFYNYILFWTYLLKI